MGDAGRVAPHAGATGSWAPGVAETHVSLLFFAGDRAYKLKKAVALPFLDHTGRAAREAACHREVELNRRLAPDVYLGVADVAGPDGAVCDHLVVMRRMPAERRLSTLVSGGADVDAGIRAVARTVAAFHAAAPRSPAIDAAATRDAVAGNWEDNLDVLAGHVPATVAGDAVERVDRLARRYLAGRDDLFAHRIAAGMVVDGHGDLLADDIFLLPDGPRILDCIDFSDRLRHLDVLDDAAFLAMDLERLGAPALAARFLRAYAELSGEHHPDSLAAHYVAYRAGVRAKVACLRAAQGDAGAAAQAGLLLDLAGRHLERGAVTLVLTGGLPGTGKSTLAGTLGERLGWAVLRSDVVRKELAGLAPAARAPAAPGEGLYDDAATGATYFELLRRAGRLLALGESVIVDASWSDARQRNAARAVAEATASDLVELRCEAPAGVAADRMQRRAAAGADPSDATPAVAAAMAARADPWPEARTVETSGPAERAAAGALEHPRLAAAAAHTVTSESSVP